MDEAVLGVKLRPDRVSRAALTNAEGEYRLDPIPPGRYRVMVQDRSWDDRHESEHVGEPLELVWTYGQDKMPKSRRRLADKAGAHPHVRLVQRGDARGA